MFCTPSTRRALLRAAIAASAAIPFAGHMLAGTVADPDPVHDAIARNLAAWQVHHKACRAADAAGVAFGFDSPEYEEADAVQAMASATQLETIAAFIETVPTTLAGALAFLDHLGHDAMFSGIAIEPAQAEAIIATLRAAIALQEGA